MGENASCTVHNIIRTRIGNSCGIAASAKEKVFIPNARTCLRVRVILSLLFSPMQRTISPHFFLFLLHYGILLSQRPRSRSLFGANTIAASAVSTRIMAQPSCNSRRALLRCHCVILMPPSATTMNCYSALIRPLPFHFSVGARNASVAFSMAGVKLRLSVFDSSRAKSFSLRALV